MSAAARIAEPPAYFRAGAPSALAVFIARAEARALLWEACVFDLHEAIDPLQEAAERDGLVDELGQDVVQAIVAETFQKVRGEP